LLKRNSAGKRASCTATLYIRCNPQIFDKSLKRFEVFG